MEERGLSTMDETDPKSVPEQIDVKKIQEMWNKRKWWEKLVIGIIAIIFGIVAFVVPDVTLEFIIYLFGFFALVIGIFSLLSGIAGAELGNARWLFVLQGILGIIIGIIALAWPEMTLLFMAYLVGFWAIMFGVFEIVGAFAAPPEAMANQNMSKGLLVVSGIISLLFGFLIVLFPGSGILAILWIVAAYAIIFGIVNVVMGFQDRNVPATSA
jgi:uncharacterized membrane protein HdeD (DUF308 family)